jgi:hypothetical protein
LDLAGSVAGEWVSAAANSDAFPRIVGHSQHDPTHIEVGAVTDAGHRDQPSAEAQHDETVHQTGQHML